MYIDKGVEKDKRLSHIRHVEKKPGKYVLLNKKEICDFIKDIDGFAELLDSTYGLIEKIFKDPKVYLAFEETECSETDLIIAYIVNEEGSFEENSDLEDRLLDDFLHLRDIYPKAFMKFNFIVEEDGEYYEYGERGL